MTQRFDTTGHAISLINRATELERIAAARGLRLPGELAAARRRMRAAMLRACAPDADTLADRLNARAAAMMANGDAAKLARTRADLARVVAGTFQPDYPTPDMVAALDELRAQVRRANAMVEPMHAPQG